MMSIITDKSLFAAGVIIIMTTPLASATELDVQFGEIRALLQDMLPRRTTRTARHLPNLRQEQRVDLHQIIRDASRTTNLEPAVLATLIKIESGFDPAALSPAGAEGLTQLMPATVAQLGIRDVWNPKSNVTGGARWLAMLLREHDGNLLKAVAAYNAGSDVIRRSWRRWPRETKIYLEKFVRYYPQFSKDWKRHTPRYIYSRL